MSQDLETCRMNHILMDVKYLVYVCCSIYPKVLLLSKSSQALKGGERISFWKIQESLFDNPAMGQHVKVDSILWLFCLMIHPRIDCSCITSRLCQSQGRLVRSELRLVKIHVYITSR